MGGPVLLLGPPLATVNPAFRQPALQAQPLLGTPLFRVADLREMATLAAVIDAALERMERVYGAPFTQAPAWTRLLELCALLRPQAEPQVALEEAGFLESFPYLRRMFGGHQQGGRHAAHYGAAAAQPAAQHPGVAYLAYVSLCNQAVMMGTQIYHDATTPAHHKYTAHQVALLYQSLNMLQGETKPIRRLIEARFDDVKAITESPNPCLPLEFASWLQQVTWVVREEVAACPGYIHRRLAPIVELLQSKHLPRRRIPAAPLPH